MAKRAFLIVGLIALYAFLAVLPFKLALHHQDFMIFLFINVLVAVSYRLMTLTGEWSLIHVVLWGVGGYASALLSKELELSVWLAMPIGAAITGSIAFLLSFPLFRMKGFYFLIGSFAAGEAIRLSWNYFTVPFGGPRGVQLIPSPTITLPGYDTIELWDAIPYYFLTLTIVTICLLILYRLEHSRIGLTLHAVHWRDSLAESIGVNPWRYRTLAFVVASFFAGLAGALFVHYLGSVNPNQFDVGIMVYVLVWVIVGGTRTFAGPIIGVAVLSVANEFFRASEELRPLIYGCILILATRFLPDGLESLPRRIQAFVEGRRAARSETGDSATNASPAKTVEG